MTEPPQQPTSAWFRPDNPSSGSPLRDRGLENRIRLHDSVLEEIKDRPALGKRLAIAAQQLAALGRTTIVKGCSDTKNRGWRRTPLGGQGGNHFYLWWTPQGSPQSKGFDGLGEGAILLRAVRHHDNHKALKVGSTDEYFALSRADLDGGAEGSFESPWTEAQRLFMLDDSPVRVVHGYPGSGKTMALWKALEARRGKTLYLTWSSALIDNARSRFSVFAPPGLDVEAREFSVFIGSLCETDIARLTLNASREEFRRAFPWWQLRDHLGPWKDNLNALHAELRAVLFGRAVPGLVECTDDGGRLSDEAYLAETSVGGDAAEALLAIVKRADWGSWYERVFPELAAARTALARICDGNLPEGLHTFDRVVVDEVQDLSLLESAVMVEFCRALALKRGHAPWLLMAYDDGQTVRPSGFDSGRLGDLLNRSLIPPRDFPLDYNVRSPRLISEVVEEASKLYTLIGKDWRPKDQQSRQVEQEINARLIHVSIPDKENAHKLMKTLADVDDVAVVSPTDTIPGWVPRECSDMVHTPETVKGLEYASVCVLDVGSLAKQLHHSTDSNGPLEIQARRTAIDGLRVAVSRATENLVFVDIQRGTREKRLSQDLLKNSETFTTDDLMEFFRDADLPLDERILARTRDALSLVDNLPQRAWQRACQALRLLGKPQEGTLASDEAIRREVSASVLMVAARRMVDSGLGSQQRKEITNTAEQVVSAWGDKKQRRAFANFDSWIGRRAKAPFDLINAALALDSRDRKWLQSALPSVLQSLLEALRRCAADPSWAPRYAGDVEAWLDLIGYTGDMAMEAEALRSNAIDALARAGKWTEADKVLSLVASPNPCLAGTILEKVGRKTEAAEAFELAGMPKDALRNWRDSGRIDKAVRLAEGEEKADLQWLVDMQELISQRPLRIQDRLDDSEKKRLNKMLRSAQTPARPRRKPPASGGLFADQFF